MNNWGFYFRGWKLSKDKSYYTVTRDEMGFKKGDKAVVICHGMGNFDVFKYGEPIVPYWETEEYKNAVPAKLMTHEEAAQSLKEHYSDKNELLEGLIYNKNPFRSLKDK